MQHLAIDQGNNHIHAALFKDGALVQMLPAFPSESWVRVFQEPTSVIYSSVAKTDEHLLQYLEEKASSLLRLTSATPMPLTIAYSSSIGTDRIAAAAGVWSMAPHQPSLIIDLGTAATFDMVDSKGIYLGGSISPGLELRLRSLHEHTAKLPAVEKAGQIVWPASETSTSIRTGAVFGLLAEIEYYIRLSAGQHPKETVQVFLTGGN